MRTWRHSDSGAPSELVEYFEQIFLNHPWVDLNVPSLVHEEEDGVINGFVGLIPRPMNFDGRPVIVVASAGIMVAPELQGQGIGLKLRTRSFTGPQALTFTDGGSDSALRIWSKSGGELCQLYCCQWFRVLRPASHFVSKLQRKIGNAALLLRPIAAIVDTLLIRLPVRALYIDEAGISPGTAGSARDIVELANASRNKSGLHPIYDEISFRWLLDQSACVEERGKLETTLVSEASGDPVGWYIYFAKTGGIADVLQIGGYPNQIGLVIRHLLLSARKAGCIAIGGQFDPRYASALVASGCSFGFRKNFIIYSADRDMLRTVHSGNTSLTRLDGEWWLNFANGPW